jgi:uncharacterized repeat protein (TIGR01451 family)
VAGGRVDCRLRLVASGRVEARGVEARLRLPAGAEVVPGSVTGGLQPEAATGELVWRGRLAPSQPLDLVWGLRLAPDLPAGARSVTRALIRAPGVPEVARQAVVALHQTDFSGSAKTAAPAVAWPGEVVAFTLRAVNRGPAERQVSLTDALPAGLELLDGTLAASAGPPPRWDAASRSLRWQGPLAVGEAVEVTFAARLVAGPVTNVMLLDDGLGTSAALWAEVAQARHRRFLPALGR